MDMCASIVGEIYSTIKCVYTYVFKLLTSSGETCTRVLEPIHAQSLGKVLTCYDTHDLIASAQYWF